FKARTTNSLAVDVAVDDALVPAPTCVNLAAGLYANTSATTQPSPWHPPTHYGAPPPASQNAVPNHPSFVSVVCPAQTARANTLLHSRCSAHTTSAIPTEK